jgi:hypothetical protein
MAQSRKGEGNIVSLRHGVFAVNHFFYRNGAKSQR